MANGGGTGHTVGRIQPEAADQVLVASMIWLSAAVFDDSDMEKALWLMADALPLVSGSARMQALRPAAVAVLEAAPHRRKRGQGATDWACANLDLKRAVAADAKASALARIVR